ncbi:G_PROTEIN_RECEP_F1_2 domain-containing protein [Meloidogyne graminicola]|uniref:G_PROTEIN_RECEP_F1_2 domain-containing protein n=1 Tax=Meloidogyne graminicola TaxID=189291 RepID=A0A8S9ZHE2_9BILA|nr:G_PROTEIN_RECEP_F1_2 domain-containing protein [Meloidogyne graminicola]
MSYNEGTTNLFYEHFKENGLPLSFVLLITLRCLISMFGCLLNISLVYITIKTKTLHSTCNVLISINALCTAIFEPTLIIGLIISLSGINFIDLNSCFWLQVLPSFFGNLTLSTLVAIGFDRVVNIILSSFWITIQVRPLPYLTSLMFVCIIYSLFYVWQLFLISNEHPYLYVICSSPGECQQGERGKFLYLVNLFINIFLMFEYVFLWIIFKIYHHKLAQNTSVFTRRILRSLTTLTILIIICWLLNSIIKLLLPLINTSPSVLIYTTFSFSFLPICAMAANAPVLFLLSHEYRQAYIKLFPNILHSYVSSYGDGVVGPVSPVLHLRNAIVAPLPNQHNNLICVIELRKIRNRIKII